MYADMHKCVYICMHDYVYLCRYLCVHTYIHTCISMYTCRYICHRHGNWVKEKMERFRCIYINWVSGMDARRFADERQHFQCACTVVFPLEDQSRQLWCHEMTSQGSLMLLREGTIKGEKNWISGLSSSDTKHLGVLTSHRPSTLTVSVPLMEQSITRMDCVICLSICMYPDLSGELLVSVTLVVWC